MTGIDELGRQLAEAMRQRASEVQVRGEGRVAIDKRIGSRRRARHLKFSVAGVASLSLIALGGVLGFRDRSEPVSVDLAESGSIDEAQGNANSDAASGWWLPELVVEGADTSLAYAWPVGPTTGTDSLPAPTVYADPEIWLPALVVSWTAQDDPAPEYSELLVAGLPAETHVATDAAEVSVDVPGELVLQVSGFGLSGSEEEIRDQVVTTAEAVVLGTAPEMPVAGMVEIEVDERSVGASSELAFDLDGESLSLRENSPGFNAMWLNLVGSLAAPEAQPSIEPAVVRGQPALLVSVSTGGQAPLVALYWWEPGNSSTESLSFSGALSGSSRASVLEAAAALVDAEPGTYSVIGEDFYGGDEVSLPSPGVPPAPTTTISATVADGGT